MAAAKQHVEWFSEPRLAPYRQEAGDDPDLAMRLYEWNARLGAACFEVMSHLEVILRNAIDRQLSLYFHESTNGIPWFFLKITGEKPQSALEEAIGTARGNLRRIGPERDNRHQIVAGLTFGFWTGMLGRGYEDLWRAALRHAFPHSRGVRADLAAACNGLRTFRNRLAHPDSLLAADVLFQLRQAVQVAGWIDPDAANWLNSIEQVTAVYADRPVTKFDTVVVPARDAWRLYQAHGLYICQAGRTFRPVERIAFYADQSIKAEVPQITDRQDNVEWTHAEAARLSGSANSAERQLGAAMADSLGKVWPEGRYQLFKLTHDVGDSRHRRLAGDVPHLPRGKGSAFTQRQRYVSLHGLETAKDTSTL
ncbi:hypothetical protein ACFP63_10255 [Oerskovia jenensis]|uniref:Abi-like protein n=1 Tax=Oerskovia jenensis TaxID=162169 RepID=A0ABS2LJ40_9CELL|nr:hypothetical protein [Oerskovia jenensis]MBM7480443.1 hypothetical protein [Oerskovia jenensis]